MTNSCSEDILIEQPTIALFAALGWEAENLTEEEMALFDLLTRPEMELSDSEREQVKRGAGGGACMQQFNNFLEA